MPPMLIDFGEELTAKAKSLAANAGFQSAEAYGIAVVRADAAETGAPGDGELDARLVARFHAPDLGPMTDDDFERIRERAGLPIRVQHA